MGRFLQDLSLRPGFQADVQPVVDAFPGYAIADGSLSQGGYEMDWNNFGPRIGFAYDVAGDGRTVVRGEPAIRVVRTRRPMGMEAMS